MKNQRKTTYFPLMGGEDLVTAKYSQEEGTLQISQNFECDAGSRYRRIDGYERYDGHPKPSNASYWVLNFDQGSSAVTAGETVTGETSGATGEVLLDAVVESGSYAGSDAAGYVVLTAVSGTFLDNENLLESAVAKLVADGTAVEKSGDINNDATWTVAARTMARSKITAVPGSGSIQGVTVLSGVVYAFRPDALNAETCLYKSSSAGWVKVDLGETINFDAGTVLLEEGDTLEGGTSGATATLKRVVVQSGDWTTSDAAGYLVIHSVSATSFQDNETITTTTGSATSDGINIEISLSTGGRYDFINHNFYSHSGTNRIYGADGVNKAFEFDGTTYVPITTGMTIDSPEHIVAYKKHLFLSFSGGSVQHSSIGEPTIWSVILGAAEIGLGENIVGFKVLPDDVLCVMGRNQISLLYGTSALDWNLKSFSMDSGGIEWSIQQLSDLVYLDDKGIMSLSTVQEYGDFKNYALSDIIRPLITAKKNLFVSSIRCKNKNQYRVFFSDKTGLNLTMTGAEPNGFTRLKYDHAVMCTCCREDANGDEMILFGSDNGMVYEMDIGNSFDGDSIECFLRTTQNSLKSPELKKRFFKIVLEKDGLQVEGFWGIDSWNNFKWDAQRNDIGVTYIDEASNGYEFFYYENDDNSDAYVLQGIILHYATGGMNR